MFQNLTPITRNIIFINIGLFILSQIIPSLNDLLSAYFPLSPNFYTWQIISHMFMHGGVLHLLFNMLTLASFGVVLENFLREKRFLILYFASGLGAFTLYNIWYAYDVFALVNQLNELGEDANKIVRMSALNYSGSSSMNFKTAEGKVLAEHLLMALNGRMVGASGAIFGIVSAFSTLFPNARMMFMFIPFPIKAKYLFPIIIFEVFVFSLGLGLWLSAITVFFRDVQYLWGVFISMWMYLTPLFYPVSIIPEEYQELYKNANPMYGYIEQFRDIVLHAKFPQTDSILIGFGTAILVLVLGAWYFNKKQDEFILYI